MVEYKHGVNEDNIDFTNQQRYNDGYNHGQDDAQIKDIVLRYINQPEKGTIDHTDVFMLGYFHGFFNYDKCDVEDIGFSDKSPFF